LAMGSLTLSILLLTALHTVPVLSTSMDSFVYAHSWVCFVLGSTGPRCTPLVRRNEAREGPAAVRVALVQPLLDHNDEHGCSIDQRHIRKLRIPAWSFFLVSPIVSWLPR
jgi:hypothetical protein